MKRVSVFAIVGLVTLGLSASPIAAAKTATPVEGAVVDCSAGTSCEVTWDDPSDLTIFFGTAVDAIDDTGSGLDAPGNTMTVNGLDPAQRYYFELVPDGADSGTVVADRSLHIEHAPNARDIGGYETKDGHHVKWGTVFRSDEIIELSDADLARMTNIGIKIVCDFRGLDEVEKRGEDKLPAGAEYVSLPVLDPKNTIAVDIENAIVSGDHEAQDELLGNGRAEKILVEGAPFLVSSDAARAAYSSLLDRLTDPASLPALTHCTTGKDRTGWSTAVILTALGVPKQTVIEDYLLTNQYSAELNESRIESAAPLMEDSEVLRPLLEVRPEYLNGSFKEVKKEFGSFANYLRKGLGVSKADLKALKQNLLTD